MKQRERRQPRGPLVQLGLLRAGWRRGRRVPAPGEDCIAAGHAARGILVEFGGLSFSDLFALRSRVHLRGGSIDDNDDKQLTRYTKTYPLELVSIGFLEHRYALNENLLACDSAGRIYFMEFDDHLELLATSFESALPLLVWGFQLESERHLPELDREEIVTRRWAYPGY